MSEQASMFHWRDNLYFGRLPDGAVRILKFSAPMCQGDYPVADKPYHDVEILLDVTIPADHWASIIASVSKEGEFERYNLARQFHQGETP